MPKLRQTNGRHRTVDGAPTSATLTATLIPHSGMIDSTAVHLEHRPCFGTLICCVFSRTGVDPCWRAIVRQNPSRARASTSTSSPEPIQSP
jgi:hypothetical protein